MRRRAGVEGARVGEAAHEPRAARAEREQFAVDRRAVARVEQLRPGIERDAVAARALREACVRGARAAFEVHPGLRLAQGDEQRGA